MDALLGGLTGVLGSGVSAVFGWLNQRDKNKHEKQMAEIRIEEIRAEAEAGVKVARVESDAAIAKGEVEAFKASYEADAVSWAKGHKLGRFGTIMLSITDFIRGTQRPMVIYALISVTMYLVIQGHSGLLDSLDYITMTAVSWLFGARTNEKLLAKLNG